MTLPNLVKLPQAYYVPDRVEQSSGHYRLKNVTPHATGLLLPSHMHVLSDGRVLVSEFGAGRVREISTPGDYSDRKCVYMDDLKHPSGIIQVENNIFVVDAGAGRIYKKNFDDTSTKRDEIFAGIPHPYGIVAHKNRLYCSFSNDKMVGVVKIDEGNHFSERNLYVNGFPVVVTLEPYRALQGCGGSWPTETFNNRILLGHAALGCIFDVTDGGSFDSLRESRFAWGLDNPLGMTVDPIGHGLYVCERNSGVIKNVVGGYSRFASPLVAGFKDPSCIRFTSSGSSAFVCDRAVGTVYKLDLEFQN